MTFLVYFLTLPCVQKNEQMRKNPRIELFLELQTKNIVIVKILDRWTYMHTQTDRQREREREKEIGGYKQ